MSATLRNTEIVRARTPLVPRVGMILGSGLGHICERVEAPVRVPFSALTGFPVAKVSGHAGELVLGTIAGVPVAVLSGRGHFYEEGRPDVMREPLATLKALGAVDLIVTNAAGSLLEEMPPGFLMLVADHINFANPNPLVGEPTDARFVGMTQAYDLPLRQAALRAADAERIPLRQGVYMWFSGPSFETPAEIRMARMLGADVVGMSTVPDVILARFLGLRVIAFSVVTNYAAGMTGDEITHEETKESAPVGGKLLARLLERLLATWPD